MRAPFAPKLIAEIGPTLGITVELEPEYQYAGELIFPDGRRHLFRSTKLNINLAGSSEIARDKGYTNYFLRKHGINVPLHKAFFSQRLNEKLPPQKRRGLPEAIEFANQLGFPVFVKPNNLSKGEFVTKAYNPADIASVASRIFEKTDVLLIEQPCPGNDYRIVVLGDKIISAYQRIPFSLVGDGLHSIGELLQRAKTGLEELQRSNSEIHIQDPRIAITLRESGKDLDTVLKAGERLTILNNANLSSGGTSVDLTDMVHPSFAAIALRVTKILGLRLCGVDLLCDDITRDAAAQTWNIIELNSAPGLDNYASLGPKQAQRVRDLYRLILEYLAENPV